MKRILLLVFLFCILQLSANAQSATYRVYTRLILPTTCSATSSSTDIVILSGTHDIHICKDPLAVYPTNWQFVGGGSGISGSGVANRVAFWSGVSSLSSNSAFTFDGTNLSVLGGRITATEFDSDTVNLANNGTFRFAKSDFIAWRNELNTGNILLTKDSSDRIASSGGFAGALTGNVTGNVTGTASGNELPLTFSSPLTRSVNTISCPTCILNTDTGTVTNLMLAGSIANSKLSNSTISGISLGSNLADLIAGTGLSGSNYNGSVSRTFSVVADAGLPSQTSNSGKFLTTNGTVSSWGTVDLTTKANTALDNLASVNINSAFLFQTGIDIGSTTKPARDIYLYGSGTYGTNYFRFTGTPTSTRIITLPDLANYTLAQTTNAQTFNGNQTFAGNILFDANGTRSVGVSGTGVSGVFLGSDTQITRASTNVGAIKNAAGTGYNKLRMSQLWISRDDDSLGVDIGVGAIDQVRLGSAGVYGISSTANSNGGNDIGLCRDGVNRFGINDGSTTCTNYRDLVLRTIKLGATTARGTTEGTNKLSIFNGTAPAGTLTNGIDLFSNAGELHVLDAAGNDTLLSPHRKETNDWIYRSKNTVTGKNLEIDMERLMRALDKLLGGGYVREDSISALENNTFSPLFTDYLLRSSATNYFANIGGTQVLTPTAGTTVTITIDPTAKEILASETATQDQSLVISGTPQDGTRLTIIITNDGVLPRTITASTGLSALSTVVGITSKKSTISFIALNGTFIETARTIGI